MVFGSSTCPVTDDAAAGLRQLHRQFGDRVNFVMVNVREAHLADHCESIDVQVAVAA
jgi:hypothetical protein